MTENTPRDVIRERNKFHQEFCAYLGLPVPKPWTEEDEARYQAKWAEANRRTREYYARLEEEEKAA